MSSLGDHLWKQVGGDVPSDPRSVARDAIQRYGSGRAAARELGVDEKTIRRWKTGETVRSEHVVRFATEARKGYADQRTGPVQVSFKYAKKTRDLNFGAGGKQGLQPGAIEAIEAAYVAGDREAMARAFIDGVTDPWYRRMMGRSYVAELDGAPGEAGEDSSSVGLFMS